MIPNQQIGWSVESKLMHQLAKQMEKLASITAKINATTTTTTTII